MNATVKQFFIENQQQMLTNQQPEKIIQQHQTSTLQQQAWITQQNASIQQQQATLQQQQALMQQQQNTIQQHQTINQQQQIINQQQEQTIKLLQSSFNTIPSIGTTYIRWGRKQCPNNNTELIYSGFAGGSHYTDPGAAAEYVCLPPDPNYVNMVTLEEKRFLINDQDILIDRLNRVENIVAILNATVKQLSTENQQQGLTIQQQEKTIQQQQTSILEHQTSIQQQKTLTQQQQSLINQQQISIYQEQTSNQHKKTLIQQHEQTIKQLQGSFSSSQEFGTTYIRWGRKQCPKNNTELVYSGYAGGGYYGVSGSASESVCLPPDPNYLKTRGTNSAQIYGGEFDNNFFSSYADGQDVPCALCRTTRATSVIMIPGKDRCYSGWKREYYGYLSSGGY
ncbi:myb-like protein K [Mytilus trossulus]|uniref:myb-like protein K n=1 Tax=Mytilus trossulus TaxID=6551 RepID=UPI00300537A0